MQTSTTVQTVSNVYALSDRLAPLQVQLCLEVGIVFCVLGFLLAQHTLLSSLSAKFVEFFSDTRGAHAPQTQPSEA